MQCSSVLAKKSRMYIETLKPHIFSIAFALDVTFFANNSEPFYYNKIRILHNGN